MMKRMNILTRRTADFWKTESGTTTAVWLPSTLKPFGALRVSSRNSHPKVYEPLGWIQALEEMQETTGLGRVLGHIGVRAQTRRSQGQVTFPPIDTMAVRLRELNARLPAEHSLPTVERVKGGSVPPEARMRMLRDGILPIADGRGTEDKHAPLVTATAIARQLPVWLTAELHGREIIGDQIANVLDMNPLANNETTPTKAFLEDFDEQLCTATVQAKHFAAEDKHAMGNADVLYALSNETVGGVELSAEEAVRLGRLSVAHVAYLGHFLPNDRQEGPW